MRGRKLTVDWKHTAEELYARDKHERNRHIAKRLQALFLLRRSTPTRQVALIVGVSRMFIHNTNRVGGVYNCPPPLGSPRFARGTAWGAWVLPLREGNRVGRVGSPASRGEPRKGSVLPACRGNLKEGVSTAVFCELWFGDWYQT